MCCIQESVAGETKLGVIVKSTSVACDSHTPYTVRGTSGKVQKYLEAL